MKHFSKPFTQQEPISEETIGRVAEILRSGRLHRYNVLKGEVSEATLLETEYAAFQGTKFCLAVTSGGQALQIALRAAGVVPGTKVLANAYTLAPVPGAIYATGGEPVFVEIDENWHTDIADLREKARTSGAKFMMLSHMRGHIADMDAITAICEEYLNHSDRRLRPHNGCQMERHPLRELRQSRLLFHPDLQAHQFG